MDVKAQQNKIRERTWHSNRCPINATFSFIEAAKYSRRKMSIVDTFHVSFMQHTLLEQSLCTRCWGSLRALPSRSSLMGGEDSR